MTEASLLVDPQQLDQHIRALRLISSAVPRTFGHPETQAEFDHAQLQALRLWRGGEMHFDHVFHGLLRSDGRWADGESTWWELVSEYVFCTEVIDSTWRKLTPDATDEQTDTVLGPVFAQRLTIRERLLTALEQRDAEAQSKALVDTIMILVQGRGPGSWGEPRDQRRKLHLRCLRAIAGRTDVLDHVSPNVLAEDPDVNWTAEDVPYLEEVARLPSEPLQQRAERLLARIAEAGTPPADDTLFTRLQQAMQQPDPPLQKLTLEAQADDGTSYPVFPTGWLACGEAFDLVWERHRRNAIYLMREAGQLERLFEFDLDTPWRPNTGHTYKHRLGNGHGLHHPCFDGQYIWAPIVGPEPLIVVIEPATGRTWRITAEAGLPPMNRGGAAIGMEPGTICLAGSFSGEDQPIRAWCAIVRLVPEADGHAEIEVFHEAIEQFHREAPAAVRWTGPKLGFRAGTMYRYTDADGREWIVAWRRFESYLGYGPLWINIERREVVARPRGPWSLSRRPALHNGRLVFVAHDLNAPSGRLLSVAGPTAPVIEHAEAVPKIHQLITWDDSLCGIDEQGLAYRIAPGERQVELLDPRLPRTDKQTRLVRSVHFGLVMLVPTAPDYFVCEAYVLAVAMPGGVPSSTQTTTRLTQPKETAYRGTVHRGLTNVQLLSRIGRPYEAKGWHWYYGGPAQRDDKPAYDLWVNLDKNATVDWIRKFNAPATRGRESK